MGLSNSHGNRRVCACDISEDFGSFSSEDEQARRRTSPISSKENERSSKEDLTNRRQHVIIHSADLSED
jgi:hypothetical protein